MAKNDPAYMFDPDEWVEGYRIGTDRGRYQEHYTKEQMVAYIKTVCPNEVVFKFAHTPGVTHMFSHYSNKRLMSKWCEANCAHYWSDSLVLQNTVPGEYIWVFADEHEAIMFKLSHEA